MHCFLTIFPRCSSCLFAAWSPSGSHRVFVSCSLLSPALARKPGNTKEGRESLTPHARRGGFHSRQAQRDQAIPPQVGAPRPPCRYCCRQLQGPRRLLLVEPPRVVPAEHFPLPAVVPEPCQFQDLLQCRRSEFFLLQMSRLGCFLRLRRRGSCEKKKKCKHFAGPSTFFRVLLFLLFPPSISFPCSLRAGRRKVS